MVSPNPYKVPGAGAGHTDKWPFYHFVGDSHDWVSVWLFRQYIYYCSRNKPDRVHSTATPQHRSNRITQIYILYIYVYTIHYDPRWCAQRFFRFTIYMYTLRQYFYLVQHRELDAGQSDYLLSTTELGVIAFVQDQWVAYLLAFIYIVLREHFELVFEFIQRISVVMLRLMV